MVEKAVEVKTGLVPDPHNVPVTFANIFGGGGLVNGVINITLLVSRFTPTFEGKTDNDVIVASRLRIDIHTAKAMRDFIQSQLDLLAAPQDKAN